MRKEVALTVVNACFARGFGFCLVLDSFRNYFGV